MTVEEMRERKRELGYSYEQLSELSGVPLGTLQKVLGGSTRAPRYETLRALEAVLLPDRQKTPGAVREEAVLYGSKEHRGLHSASDYYALPEGTHRELIDGQFYEMAEPHGIHQLVRTEIGRFLSEYVRKQGGSCLVFSAPVNVHLDADDRTVVAPDITVLCDRDKFRRGRIYGAPDLVVEVLSPSTAKKDRYLKLWKYTAAGVREYWLVDWQRGRVVVYQLEEAENGQEIALYGFQDAVPVGIWGGACAVNFAEIEEFIAPLKD